MNPLNLYTIHAKGAYGWLRVFRNQGQTWSLVSGKVPNQIREIIVRPQDTLEKLIKNVVC